MCIAILTKPGAVVPTGNIARSASRNRDGGGFAYVDRTTKEVVIRKGFMKASEFMQAYRAVLAEGHHEENPMLIHFRIATLGKVNADNCHPFPVPGGAMIHNGSLWYGGGYGSMDVEKSDTREFAERITINLDAEVLKKVQPVLDKAIGYNKMAFLFNNGEYSILNEEDGYWEEDIWYSNRAYAPLSSGTGRTSTDALVEEMEEKYPSLAACGFLPTGDDDWDYDNVPVTPNSLN